MNLKFLKYSSIILILSCFNLSFSQGYVFEDEDYVENYESYSKSVLGFTSEIPKEFMLTDYVPPIGNQKDSGSCVAWSVAVDKYLLIPITSACLQTPRDIAARPSLFLMDDLYVEVTILK